MHDASLQLHCDTGSKLGLVHDFQLDDVDADFAGPKQCSWRLAQTRSCICKPARLLRDHLDTGDEPLEDRKRFARF